MQNQATATAEEQPLAPAVVDLASRRRSRRDVALRSALRKREDKVPTYTVPEAAALLSVSHEHLYRLIHADAFPAVRVRVGHEQGRFIVPAQAVEALLDTAIKSGASVDAGEFVGGAR
jgi:excisionase family DNA binding protein